MLPQIVTDIPGPKSRVLARELRAHECRNTTYVAADFPIFWERAEGVNVWDADGNRFLDLTSAFGVAGLGHTNAKVRDALVAQSSQLFHAMGDVHPTAVKAELCRELSRVTFGRWNAGNGKVILGNSGSDAVEAALKTSLLHSGKPGVIAFTGAYHGLGYGALETGGIPFFKEKFRTQLKDFATILPFPSDPEAGLTELQNQTEETIAMREIGAILVEPIQGRGGIVVPPPDFLRMLRAVCDTHKILLIADEIYTGFNRTGALFACELSGVAPDVICLGKGMASGFPISACVARADVMDAWPESGGEALHTSTFLGNPLGCAMALESIRQHSDPALSAQVRETGAKFKAALKKIKSPRAGEVRGAGLMLGLEVIASSGSPDGAFAAAAMKRGLRDGLIFLCDSPAGNVLAFTPPFAISDDEVAFVAAKIQEYFTSLPGSIS
jgi:4-aminobutyrate aminotransferase-like enzyme